MNEVPTACRGCTKTEAQVDMCRIRIYQFNVFGMKCPREKPIGATPPLKEPKPAGFEPATPRELISHTREVGEVLTTNIRLEDLETNVFSPRKVFNQRYVDDLAESIEREGQLKPVLVRPHPEKPSKYQLIDGEHRVRGLTKCGRNLVRAEVRDLSDEEALFLAIKINQMHGKRLEAIEEGLHVKTMMEKFGYTQTKLAEKLSKSQQWVSQRLKLVRDTSEELMGAFTTAVVSLRKTREIAELPKEDQPSVLERVVKEKLGLPKIETLVHALKDHPDKKEEILAKPINELTPPPEDIQEFEEEHGPEQPKFETGRCPECGKEYTINWVLTRINWKEEAT